MNAAGMKAEDLWEKYYMLSAEMLKFIESDEVDMMFVITKRNCFPYCR